MPALHAHKQQANQKKQSRCSAERGERIKRGIKYHLLPLIGNYPPNWLWLITSLADKFVWNGPPFERVINDKKKKKHLPQKKNKKKTQTLISRVSLFAYICWKVISSKSTTGRALIMLPVVHEKFWGGDNCHVSEIGGGTGGGWNCGWEGIK